MKIKVNTNYPKIIRFSDLPINEFFVLNGHVKDFGEACQTRIIGVKISENGFYFNISDRKSEVLPDLHSTPVFPIKITEIEVEYNKSF